MTTIVTSTDSDNDNVKIISSEKDDSILNLLDIKKPQLMMIFTYLDLSEQNKYSRLNYSTYNDFRLIFLLLSCNQKFSNGFTEINILAKISASISMFLLNTTKHLHDDTIHYVIQIQKDQHVFSPPFIQDITDNPVSNYVMFHRHSVQDEEKSSFSKIDDLTQEYTTFAYLYNVKKHALHVSPVEQKNCQYYKVKPQEYDKAWPWIFKANGSLPLFIHYTIDDVDHYDFLGGYANVKFETNKATSLLKTMSCYSIIEPHVDYPKIIFEFDFTCDYQTSNTVVEHITMNCVYKRSLGHEIIVKNFWIKDSVLQLPVAHSFDNPNYCIKSIVTCDKIITLETIKKKV